MSQQTIKQQARRTAREMGERRRRERVERERRIEGLVVLVITAIGERDAAVVETEHRAGVALRELTEREGLTLSEAVEWCDGQVGLREAMRLRRLPDEASASVSDGSARLAGGVSASGAVG